MMDVFRQASGVILMLATTVGPVLGALLLLNYRDRRQASLLAGLLDLTPRSLRDRIVFEVRCGLFSRRRFVAVDMRECSRDEIWEAIARWCAGLPPHTRLLVDGRMDGGVPATFTIETACRSALCRRPRPSPAAA